MRNAGIRCDFCAAVDTLLSALRVAAWNFRHNCGEEIDTVSYRYASETIDVAIELIERHPKGGRDDDLVPTKTDSPM
jgi:hypothetical protein